MFREVSGGFPLVQSWRPNPGCPARKRHVVPVIRGATQLACRLEVANDAERKWMLRATRSSDEVRYLSERRRPARSTARRLVRWPPDGEPQAEPFALQKPPVASKRSASADAESAECAEELHSPPTCVAIV